MPSAARGGYEFRMRWTVLLAALVAGWVVVPAAAQDAERVAAGAAAWREARCATCHGTFAEGGDGMYAPKGANLRRTALDRGAVVETVRCGRPGRDMPSLLRGAYVEAACLDVPLGALPQDVRPWRRKLTAAQIEAVVDFLFARVIGNPAITRADCELFHGVPEPCVGF